MKNWNEVIQDMFEVEDNFTAQNEYKTRQQFKKGKCMKRVHMALCFLDDDDKIVTKEDLNIHWILPEGEEKNRLVNVLVMDEVAAMLNYALKDDLYTRIRELIEKSTEDKLP